MRIGMIMDTPFPPDMRVENEAGALLANGHEIYLFHIDYEERISSEVYEGVKITRHKAGKLLYKLSALAYTFPFFRWQLNGPVKDFIRKTNIDVLHIHDMVIAEAVFNANESFSLPVVMDLHENRPEIMKLYKHTNKWPGNWLINLDLWQEKQKILMQHADHVIFVTEEARQAAARIDDIPKEKTTVLPNTVSLDRYNVDAKNPAIEKLTEGKFTLLYVGDTSIRRGTLNALKAAEILQKKIPELQLILVGDSSQDHLLHTFVKENQLSNSVHFEGWQEPGVLPAYINASDLCLSPLLRNPHHDTTYANKLFQYMAGGRAVVVSDCPAQAKIVKDEGCGLIHRADDVEDLADKIMVLYEHRAKRLKMGKRGAEAVRERWNWNITGTQLLKVYDEIGKKL